MPKTRVFLLMIATALVSVIATLGVQEQRTRREPQFDNEHVKVWKSIILPNQPLRLHRHDNGRALIALTDGKLNVVNKAGEHESRAPRDGRSRMALRAHEGETAPRGDADGWGVSEARPATLKGGCAVERNHEGEPVRVSVGRERPLVPSQRRVAHEENLAEHLVLPSHGVQA